MVKDLGQRYPSRTSATDHSKKPVDEISSGILNPDLLQATLVIRVRHDTRHDKMPTIDH
jgi:hypothetical protein